MERIPSGNEQIPELNFSHLAPEVWNALGKLQRAGWVKRNVQNPETVQEHTQSLRRIAAAFPGLDKKDRHDLLNMLEVHDWPEAVHGDEIVISADPEELQRLTRSKFENEKAVLESICAKIGDKGQEIMQLWLRFEDSEDPVASLARQLDKYQAVEKAMEYEKAQNIPLFEEFLNSARDKIQHPILLEMISKLKSSRI